MEWNSNPNNQTYLPISSVWTCVFAERLQCARNSAPTKEKVKKRSQFHWRQCGIPLRKLNKCSFNKLTILTGTPIPRHRKCSQTLLLYIVARPLNLKNRPHLWTPRWPPTSLPGSGDISDSSSRPVSRYAVLMLGIKGGWWVHKGLIGDLELPPVANPQLRLCPLELYVWTVGGMEAHTERRLCSCRLMQWLIDPEPLYSFTTGFEIQHCTWGAMCVPSLSPCINLSLYLPFSDLPSLPFRLFVFLTLCAS